MIRTQIDHEPGAVFEDSGWAPAETQLKLEDREMGPFTAGAITVQRQPGGATLAGASIELTIEQIDSLIEGLQGIKARAIEKRGFVRIEGIWRTNPVSVKPAYLDKERGLWRNTVECEDHGVIAEHQLEGDGAATAKAHRLSWH
jgi:hypothetical protein